MVLEPKKLNIQAYTVSGNLTVVCIEGRWYQFRQLEGTPLNSLVPLTSRQSHTLEYHLDLQTRTRENRESLTA